jgi:hypothetical protein
VSSLYIAKTFYGILTQDIGVKEDGYKATKELKINKMKIPRSSRTRMLITLWPRKIVVNL